MHVSEHTHTCIALVSRTRKNLTVTQDGEFQGAAGERANKIFTTFIVVDLAEFSPKYCANKFS